MSVDPAKEENTAPQSRVRSSLGTLFIKIFRVLCIFSITFSLLIGAILTPWGTKATLNLTDKLYEQLSIRYQSGSLLSALNLSSVTWQQSDAKININNLRLSITPACLLSFEVCIESIRTDKTTVEVAQPKSSGQDQPTTAILTLPIPVSIQYIEVNEFALNIKDTAHLTWQKLTGKLDFHKTLRIEEMQLNQLAVRTLEADEQNASRFSEPFNFSKWEYQPIRKVPFHLPLHFEMLAFDMNEISVKLASKEELTLNKVNLKASGNNQKVILRELVVEAPQGQILATASLLLDGTLKHELVIEADTNWVEKLPAKILVSSEGDINSLSLQAKVTENTASINTQLDNSEDDPLTLVLDIVVQPSNPLLPIKGKINWHKLSWPLGSPEVNSDIGTMEVSGDLENLKIAIDTSLAGKNFPYSTLNIAANAIATSQNKRLELDKLLINTLGGKVLSKGHLKFTESIEWNGNTAISGIDPSVHWPAWQADINGEVASLIENDNGILKGKISKLDINGHWQNYPLTINGVIDYHQQQGLNLSSLTLKNADNQFLIHGGISKHNQFDIEYELIAPDIANTIPQFGGSIKLQGSLTGNTKQPEFNYEFAGNDLSIWQVFVKNALGTGNLKWNDQKPIDLELELSGLQGNNNQIENAKLSLKGHADKHQLSIVTTGQSTSVNLSIQGQFAQTSWNGEWLSGEIKSSYANLSLQQPFNIKADWVNNLYAIAPHCWEHGNNELCINRAKLQQNVAEWDLSLKEFDVLSVVHRSLPSIPKIKTKSRLNLKTSGEWDLDELPNAKLQASLSPGVWDITGKSNLNLELDETLFNLQLTPERTLAEINLSGSKIGSVKATMQGLAGGYSDPFDRPIEGDFLINRLNLQAFKALAPKMEVLQGIINGQGKVSGSFSAPMLTGDLNLINGAIKDESLPVSLSAVEQNVVLAGEGAEFDGSYQLGNGVGKLQGSLTWTPTLKGNLQITGEALEFDYQNTIKAKVSPNIDISFEPNNLELNGDITIPYARIKVQELPKDTISPSKDVILVENQTPLDAIPQRIALNVLLKVDPSRNGQVKLDAFGLTTDLRGNLKLKNNSNEIFGSGEIALINGRYKAYGQNLLIREGDLIFTNVIDRPYLNIEAIRDPDLTADGVIAGLKVEGEVQSPNVSVFSEPVMEQQQVLAYMLTGRGLGESSGDSQDTVLTNALLSLGLGKSENLISKVGNKIGFDDVTIETSGQGDATQLSLSGTLAPGVQLRYGVGVFDSISEVAVRYQLIPKLYLEAVSGVSNAIDIYYQFSVEGSQNKKVKEE
ncbi:translocation/assembly module TamB domain-containing protein [uncultured Paraglaciecola sp.]|uniref:autotransporter assembly complex protein TamB n=1 Tax=uncultured Paraglaciecola sp. TaxID=1765024 RepID=UPI002610A041|nr:translocation/assembly module TamB domain-containing protein [uncultured Paraglaciecola sp.]